ncbi:MAG: homoserine dehydrogenase [Methyloligellaceae bacterium]
MNDTLNIGIAGLGTVGCGLLTLLQQNSKKFEPILKRNIKVTGVSARDRDKARAVDISGLVWFDDAAELAVSPEIDVFVELIGGEDGIARQAVEKALRAGKHVVTANKAMLALHGLELAALAETHERSLNFEAAIAGGIPIVKTLRETLIGNEVKKIYGIMNGTCNYILTKMENEGRSYDDVLKEAQDAGYAEADPTFDVGGHDTAHKLAVLTSLAFGVETSFDSIYLEGIQSIRPQDIEAADALGYRIKLLGVSTRTESGIEQRVHPTMIPKHATIAQVDGVTNCVAVEGDFVGEVMLTGPGAGAGATASSVMSDIVDIARNISFPPLAFPAANLRPYVRAKMRAHEGSYYIRLAVHDRPGAFASIASRMAEQNISLESIVQHWPKDSKGDEKSKEPSELMPVILVTHQTNEAAIRKALDAIEADGQIVGPAQMIRIEDL